ncbi:MFS transporter [Mycolicibacterium agri]|uniref:MFS transporter n=1 Tax=Mycolicibacterium agri TaxID=36811 RepID=A0A2A7NDT2_MYCAG|nr:MFS transporter [Mycolicibacterium agri]PEG41933.1 MFS transporter [Mycolicibacterium agri]GFG49936.1 MFS transporter [Mycolicibacterium agri]
MPSNPADRSTTFVDANLLTRLDRAPVTRTLRVGIGVVVLVWLLESFDIGLVSVLILVLGPHWELSSGEIGLLGASGTIGLLAGMLPAGRLADLYGRKKVLMVGTAMFSVFTLLSAFSPNFVVLIILRIVAGLGEGAIFPVPYLMISELVNKEKRGRIMGYAQWVLNGGYTLPALVGLWAVSTFDTEWSWRVPCLIGGLPLLLIPVLAKWVPESPRFQLRKATRQASEAPREDVRKLVTRIEDEAGIAHDETVVDPEILAVLDDSAVRGSMRMRQLLKAPYLRRSVIAYAALTASFIVWYTMLTYAPTIFGMLGATKSNSLLYTGVMMFVSAFGVFYQGRLADSRGRKPVFAVYMVVAAIGLVLLTLEPVVGIVVVVIGALATAWFGLGSFSIPKMYMAEQYPTRLRGLGTSVGEMVSRGLTGGILVAFLPGLIAGFGVTTVLTAAAISMVLLAAPMFFFGQETSGRNMEDLGTDLSDREKQPDVPRADVEVTPQPGRMPQQ